MVLLLAFVLFFGIWLLPYAIPDLDGTKAFALYRWSSTLVATSLAITAGVSAAVALPANVLGWRVARSSLRALGWSATGLAICLAVQAIVIVAPKPLPSGSDTLKFDAARWRSPGATTRDSEGLAPRQRMLEDVVSSVLPQRTKEQVEADLGPSEPTVMEGVINSVSFAGGDLNYALGADPDEPESDAHWLMLWFDADGRYARYHLAKMSAVAERTTAEWLKDGTKLLLVGLWALAFPVAVYRWRPERILFSRVTYAAVVCSVPLLVAGLARHSFASPADLSVYFGLKLLAYSAWTWFGVRLLTGRRSIAEAVGLGFLRVLLGLGFGTLIWQLSTMALVASYWFFDSFLSASVFSYLTVYVPVRWLEWGIVEGWIRRSMGWKIVSGWEDASAPWRAGGIVVSCSADLFMMAAIGGLPVGRFWC